MPDDVEKPRTVSEAEQKILIVGFGIAGIVQCHTLLSNGFRRVTVVEAEASFGGVWNLTKHYPGLTAQNSRHTWELPEMRADDFYCDTDFPTQEQVNAYLRHYIDKFELEKYVQYETRVENISRRHRCLPETSESANAPNRNAWIFDVTFSRKADEAGSYYQDSYDFLICATGFTCVPHLPEFIVNSKLPSDVTVIHSSQVRKHLAKSTTRSKDDDGSRMLLQGKHVVVIGSSKSAQDLAAWAASIEGTKSVDMVSSAMHWAVPQYFDDQNLEKGLALHEQIYSRAQSLLLPCDPDSFCDTTVAQKKNFLTEPSLRYFLQSTKIGNSVRDFAFKTKLKPLAKRMGMSKEMTPTTPFCYDNRYLMVAHPKFHSFVNDGKIRVVFGNIDGLEESNGHLLVRSKPEAGTSSKVSAPLGRKKYDIILCATGFEKSVDTFLSDEIKSHLYNEYGQMHLFRNVYCPDVPQMAFVGFHQSINNMFTAAIQARWIAELCKGSTASAVHRRGVLENDHAVHRSIEAGLAFERRFFNDPHAANGYFTTGMSCYPYIDRLLKDIFGNDSREKTFGGTSRKWLEPIVPRHCKGMIGEAGNP